MHGVGVRLKRALLCMGVRLGRSWLGVRLKRGHCCAWCQVGEELAWGQVEERTLLCMVSGWGGVGLGSG